MAIPSGVSRVSINGHLGTSEIFDTGFWVQAAVGSQADATTIASQVATVLTASGAMTNTLKMIGSSSGYDGVTVYSYAGGSSKALYSGQASLALTGTGTGLTPNQMAIVVSLRSALVGRSNRGRMYLPANAAGLDANRFLSVPTAAALANEWAAIFHNVIESPHVGGFSIVPEIVSPTHGTFTNITQVIVDSRPDIQRRRADRQGSGARGSAVVTV